MKRTRIWPLALALTLVGLGIFAYKSQVLKFPVVPKKASDAWWLEVELDVKAATGPLELSLLVPDAGRGHRIVSEDFLASGFGYREGRTKQNRRATWTRREGKGDHKLYYRALVIAREKPLPPRDSGTVEARDYSFPGIEGEAVDSVLRRVKRRSVDVESTVFELCRQLRSGKTSDVLVLQRRNERSLGYLVARMLNDAGIPARIVHGVELHGNSHNQTVSRWLEVWGRDTGWQSYSLADGSKGVSSRYLPWWSGNVPAFRVLQGEGAKVKMTISVSNDNISALKAAAKIGKNQRSIFTEYSLLNLPLRVQAVYQVLLMIPLGALILIVMRNVVGVKLFGTFMPVLIALSLRESSPVVGVTIFCGIVGTGLVVRSILARLRLLMVPRLAALLCIIVLLMMLISIVAERLDIAAGISIALFPMVIMTLTIERMSVVWDEQGGKEAFVQGVGSLIVVMIIYPVMNGEMISHAMLVFPELNLICLAGCLLMGRYSGYRLSELYRFRAALADDESIENL